MKMSTYQIRKTIIFKTGEILFESGSSRTSLFRRRTFWLLFGPSNSNNEKIFFIEDRNDHIQFGNDIILYKLSYKKCSEVNCI